MPTKESGALMAPDSFRRGKKNEKNVCNPDLCFHYNPKVLSAVGEFC